MKRKSLLFLTTLMAALTLTGCQTDGQTDTTEENYPDVEPIYTIVRGDLSSKEETDGAVRLRNTLAEYGIKVELVTDWIKRDANVEDHRYSNEIIFGDTNRNESIAAFEALHIGARGMVNFSVTSDAEDYILAASPGYVDEAVDALLAVFTEDLTRLGTAPVEVDVSQKHAFPMEDITICGVSVEDYAYIVYENTYSDKMIADIQVLSDTIFNACGTRLPLQREAPIYTDRAIRIGEKLDEEVQAGGDFSYGVIPSADGLLVEGQDIWNDWVALDALIGQIEDAMAAGGVLAIDEPILRITDPADDSPTANLLLSAWTIGATDMTTEEQIAEIAECGFNLVTIFYNSNDEHLHDLAKWMAKYQLRGLWSDWRLLVETWQDGEGSYTYGWPEYVNSSICWGSLLKDEPNATMYESLAAMKAYYDEAAPGKVPYTNLFPIYANADQMKVATYQEYVDQFFDTVNPSYASVDIYPLNIGNNIIDDYFVNLEIFSAACRERSVPFGVYIQSVSFATSKRTPVEAELRWQAYNALAFGATNIEYFTYRTPDSSTESFKNALIDRNNERTDRWYAAQKINSELTAMGDAFLGYDHLGCWGVNMQNAPSFFYFDNQYTGFDAITDVTVSNDKTLLMGGFASKENEDLAFVCVNAEDPGKGTSPIEVTVELADDITAVTLYKMGEVTRVDGKGTLTFTLDCGEGVFVELHK